MTATSTLEVRVRSVTFESENILGFELVPVTPQKALPRFTAGAHIDLHLPSVDGHLIRSYSLLNDPAETHRYCIGVNLEAKSRGGSSFMHKSLRVGDTLTIGAPRNHFELDETAPHNVFIAGGIGITPILSMIARSTALRTPWQLHYATRAQRHAGYLDILSSYQGMPGTAVHLHHDLEAGGKTLSLRSVVDQTPEGAHIYCCGPAPMLQAYEDATSGLPRRLVHREYFASTQSTAATGGFSIELAKRKKTLSVRPGQTILDCLIEAHAEPPYSCREGVCGTCEVRVLDGTPDHRDLVLTDAEKAENNRIMVCCSGAKSPRLVLDL